MPNSSPSSLQLLSDSVVTAALDTLLEGAYWPGSLEVQQCYARLQDDTEGATGEEQEVSVVVGPDGDVWLRAAGGATALRFRTYSGGGHSLRTRNALLVLAEAIRRDNEDRPQAG